MITQALAPSNTAVHHYIQPNARRARRKWNNAMMLALTGLMSVITLIPLFWIIGYVVIRGSQSINLAFLTQTPRPIGMEGGGVLHSIEGTLLLILLATLFALPPGILAAFYTVYHPNNALGIAIRFGTDVLSGIPSVVIGIFGYILIVRPMGHYSALAGAIALSIIMLPTIIRTTEEMLKLVPQSLREGSLALGAPEWWTAWKVTFPAAIDGIVTGFLLGIARASGETAPLLFTALGNDRFEIGRIVTTGIHGGQSVFQIIGNLFDQPVDSLPLTLFKYSQQPFPERVNQSWGVALVLIVIVLLTNIFARMWVARRSSKAKGA
jgi:phosphate transport system permease protein